MCSGPMVMVCLNPCLDGEAESEPEERSHVQRSDGDGESEPETTSAVQRPDGQIVCTLKQLPAIYFHLASQVHG